MEGPSQRVDIADDLTVSSPLLDRRSSINSERYAGALWTARGRTLEAARHLQRAGTSRFLREPSVTVRESATDQLEERQSDWAYSRPVVFLDLLWNLSFVTLSAAVLLISRKEQPVSPLRLWVVGYTLQCLLHMACVWSEYSRRTVRTSSSSREEVSAAMTGNNREQGQETIDIEDSDSEESEAGEEHQQGPSFAKRIESCNTMFSFAWWMVGFWFILADVDNGFQKAPLLSWLCTLFLAFDVFFVAFCLALACVIGLAVCCCLPCIIAVLYAMKDREGATEDDIKAIPQFKFKRLDPEAVGPSDSNSEEPKAACAGVMVPLQSQKQDGSSAEAADRHLSAEDAECCICITSYENGCRLRALPCQHHFHSGCIETWLKTKPTCPLCKYNIITKERISQSQRREGDEGSSSSSSSTSEEDGQEEMSIR